MDVSTEINHIGSGDAKFMVQNPSNNITRNRYMYQRRYVNPQPVIKNKAGPVHSRPHNPSTEIVLREKNIAIKNLESQVTNLQNIIKGLDTENKTLVKVQNRQERELLRLREGITDIPALLRSHKSEVKAKEAMVTSLKKQIRDCENQLKSKNDILLKRDQEVHKMNLCLKQMERQWNDTLGEMRVLKLMKKLTEEENKRNEDLKAKNDRLHKLMQEMSIKTLNCEERLGSADHHNAKLKDELSKLQKKCEEMQQNEVFLKKSVSVSSVGVQTETATVASVFCATENPEMVSVSCMTEDIPFVLKNRKSKKKSDKADIRSESQHRKNGYSFSVFDFPHPNYTGCKPLPKLGQFAPKPLGHLYPCDRDYSSSDDARSPKIETVFQLRSMS